MIASISMGVRLGLLMGRFERSLHQSGSFGSKRLTHLYNQNLDLPIDAQMALELSPFRNLSTASLRSRFDSLSMNTSCYKVDVHELEPDSYSIVKELCVIDVVALRAVIDVVALVI
jgi:hypothetical protein